MENHENSSSFNLFQKMSWIQEEWDEQLTFWIIMTHYYFSHSRHLQVCFSMKVCQNLFYAKIFIELGFMRGTQVVEAITFNPIG